jgi:N-acetylglutamate synthase
VDETERVAAALCRMWRARTVALGGTLHEHDGVLSCLTGLDFAPFNPSLIERSPVDPAAALVAAEEVYRGTGLPFGIDLEPSLHPDVRSAAEVTGLRTVESRPGMTAVPSEVVDVPAPRGVVIGPAREHLDAVADVATAGFGGELVTNRGFVASAVFDDPRARIYLAWLDGRPVATVETSIDDGMLGVFGVATVPDARRTGIGAAVTAFAVRDRAADADLAYLQSSDDGHGVYARLGFRDTSIWEVWSRA